jgi:hypothetical protein
MADEARQIVLTDSQSRQLIEFYGESAGGESVMLRAAPDLGGGYLEVIVLGVDGEPTHLSSASCSRPNARKPPGAPSHSGQLGSACSGGAGGLSQSYLTRFRFSSVAIARPARLLDSRSIGLPPRQDVSASQRVAATSGVNGICPDTPW